ncbi:MAG TPA: tetratricopeptide repeat protein [Myxococcaceae bacterium]|nr:tetratricopeptide repeat protein [Myxococcaceae bacterium]
MARFRACPALAPAALGLCLAGCFYPGDRGRLLENKVDQLAANDAEIIKKLNDTDEKVTGTFPRVEQKLGEMTKAMEGLDKASRRSDADIGVQLQKAVEDVQQLRGQVETYLHRIETLEQGLKALQESTDKRLGELADKEAAKQAEAKARADALKKPATAKEMLELADEKAKAGDRSLARQLYAELIQKWPKDALAGQSEFGLAEAYYADNKCEDALSHYGVVFKEYAKLPAVPDALLHASDCFRRLKMTDASRDALNELIKNHPKSEAAKTAKTKLAELEKAPKSPPMEKGIPPKKGGKK